MARGVGQTLGPSPDRSNEANKLRTLAVGNDGGYGAPRCFFGLKSRDSDTAASLFVRISYDLAHLQRKIK